MSVGFAPIPIILILAAAGLLTGFFVLLIKGGPVMRGFLAFVLLVVVVGFFGLFSMRASIREISAHETRPLDVQWAVVADPGDLSRGATLDVVKNDTLWRQGLEEELVPLVYSGPQTAAFGLGFQLQVTIEDLPQPPGRIVLTESDAQADIALLEEVRRGLRSVLPEATVVIAEETAAETAPQTDVRIQVKMTDQTDLEMTVPELRKGVVVRMAQVMKAGTRGTLRAVVQTADNKYYQQVEFDRRTWLYDVEEFLSTAAHRRWTMIASEEPAVSEQQALRQATDMARRYLEESLRTQDGLSRDVGESDLQDYGFVVDTYTQQLQGLSGSIWRAAMLLDVSPERLQMLQRDKALIAQHIRRTWAFQAMSLAGMILLIGVLAMTLNTLTKGYYSGTIVIIALSLVLVFAAVLLLGHW